ncbi:capsular biosynthesis protein [Providencia rettgeri]|uniref:capsular biosynthesis protein n=1 Tax=Providencia rettgeri TaxID=587 RepID=UPI0005B3BF3E|nr:capsular biosynthesis protein [Providencia rettgeri]
MIIIPMAGLSSRFTKAGYKKPKYMLELNERSLFEYSVSSFESYFKTDKFIFIIRDIENTFDFVKTKIEKLGIDEFEIILLEKETRGQAETVAIALEKIKTSNEPIFIFNIDSIRIRYKKPSWIDECDGYIEVFKGKGDNWSFVLPGEGNSVLFTAEKKQISDLCSSGLYYFKNKSIFLESYNEYTNRPKEEWEKGELYIAPLYNYSIKNKKIIKYDLVSKESLIFCGIPDEYKYLKKNNQLLNDIIK